MLLLKAILIFLNLHFAYSNNDWIDPHDMNQNQGEPVVTRRTVHLNQQAPTTSGYESISLSHFKRLISILLNSVGGKNEDYVGHFSVEFSQDNFNFLKEFIESKNVDTNKLRKVDQILSSSISRPFSQDVENFITPWNDYFYYLLNSSTVIILLSTLFVLFLSFKLFTARLTVWSVFKYLLFLGWIIDFGFTWIHLVQEAEIDKLVLLKKYQDVSPQCDATKMSVWQYLWSFISDPTDCREYHSLVYKESFWSVPPLTVISHQLGVIIYTPASHIGKALGNFTYGLLSTLPWGVNVILLPVLLLFSIVVLCIILSFITQTSIAFNILHVFQLKFGNRQKDAVGDRQRDEIGDVLSGSNLTRLLDITHRRLVEDVKISSNEENKNNAQDSDCSENRAPPQKWHKMSRAKPHKSNKNTTPKSNQKLQTTPQNSNTILSLESKTSSTSGTSKETDNSKNNKSPKETREKLVLSDDKKIGKDDQTKNVSLESGGSGDCE